MMTDHDPRRVLARRFRNSKRDFANDAGFARATLLRMGRLLFPALGLEELDVHVAAVDANEFAAAVGKAGGRQQQKKFLEVEALDRALEREQGIRIRDGLEHAITAPGSVDAHDADVIASAERHAIQPFFLFSHDRDQPSGANLVEEDADCFAGLERLPLLQPLRGRAPTAR